MKKRDPLDDESLWVPTSCAVCKKCLLDVETLKKYGIKRCLYGGPFTGYVNG